MATTSRQLAAPKVLVAVHGIGDQFNYATVQSVALRLSAYYGVRTPIPLGSFYQTEPGDGVRILMSPPPQGVPAGLGFAEVYWADIPREVVKRGYELEESKKWAKTIAGRVHAIARADMMKPHEGRLIENVLEELIDTITVVERLCFIAEKAGVFKFSLQRIMADFVNDVQLVADFPSYRRKILEKFDLALATVARQTPRPEIYLIAHSEGTVVTLAGLLRAIGMAPRPPWLDQVRGVMTIGSPLDTHMLLWPELWKPLAPPVSWKPSRRIPWYNYYDYGDPIADSLTFTREWLNAHRCDGVFEIQDFKFGRYYFPGKAHVDYWDDEHVFGHFIEHVTDLPPEVPRVAEPVEPSHPPAARRSFTDPPPSRWWPRTLSYVAPYGLIAAPPLGAAVRPRWHVGLRERWRRAASRGGRLPGGDDRRRRPLPAR